MMIFARILLLVAFPSICMGQSQPDKPQVNLIKMGEFEKFQRIYSPWAGVDGQNFLRTFEARASVVTNEGNSVGMPVPCTPNAVDLNGDGLLDLVVVDARGFTWFYPNGGSPTLPKFSHGEIIPLMLSRGGAQCPGMQAIDYDDSGKTSLVYGDWLGQIFYVPNMGGKLTPGFSQPPDATTCLIRTESKGTLWGNYFFPTVYDWDGDGKKDLIIGEGTYSANSIWLFLNQGSNSQPVFSEKAGKRISLVRGLGREHLTPVVVDWNGDGIPDIVTGERQGGVSVYVNETPPGSSEYKFRAPVTIRFGNQENIGALSRLRFADMDGDGLMDAIIGHANGRIGIALNKGTKTEPKFDAIKDIVGINPFPYYAFSPEVEFSAPVRSTFHLLKIVSKNKTEPETYEEGYTPPPGSKGNHSLKLEFFDTKQKLFINPLPLDEEDKTYSITMKSGFSVIADKEYTLSFWVRGKGFESLTWQVKCGETFVSGKDEDGINVTNSVNYDVSREFGVADAWNNVRATFKISRREGMKSDKPLGCGLKFYLRGQGTFYVDDLTVTEGNSPF